MITRPHPQSTAAQFFTEGSATFSNPLWSAP
jgi:hypothetical protein